MRALPGASPYAGVVTAQQRIRQQHIHHQWRRSGEGVEQSSANSPSAPARMGQPGIPREFSYGALGGTRTPTMLLTATSRQRVYQFRHERSKERHNVGA
jgi:hypothetical protein